MVAVREETPSGCCHGTGARRVRYSNHTGVVKECCSRCGMCEAITRYFNKKKQACEGLRCLEVRYWTDRAVGVYFLFGALSQAPRKAVVSCSWIFRLQSNHEIGQANESGMIPSPSR